MQSLSIWWRRSWGWMSELKGLIFAIVGLSLMDDGKDAPPVPISLKTSNWRSGDKVEQTNPQVEGSNGAMVVYQGLEIHLSTEENTSNEFQITYQDKGKGKVCEDDVGCNNDPLMYEELGIGTDQIDATMFTNLTTGFEKGGSPHGAIVEGLSVGRVFRDKADFRLQVSINYIKENYTFKTLRNVATKFSREKRLHGLVIRARKAYTVFECARVMAQIDSINPACREYLQDVGFTRWTKAYFMGDR
ncbi:unnamed protein product [Cochlearia groenlandica]